MDVEALLWIQKTHTWTSHSISAIKCVCARAHAHVNIGARAELISPENIFYVIFSTSLQDLILVFFPFFS